MSDHRSEPINFYNILESDRHDLTLSIISYLLSDRRSDANYSLKLYVFVWTQIYAIVVVFMRIKAGHCLVSIDFLCM